MLSHNMIYVFFTCVLTIVSPVFALGGRRCNSCNHYYTPVHYNNTLTIVEEKIIHSPVRVERYREVKGLRLVEASNGDTLVLLGNKVLNGHADGSQVVNVTEEIKGSVVTERIINKRDVYGNQSTTVEKIISK